MKKQAAVAIALFAMVTAGLAQSGSANIIISGKVKALAAITATAAPALTDTELNTGVTDKQMSVVNEKSNRNVGYSVALKSANAAAAGSSQARLNGISAGNPDLINYSIKYNGVNSQSRHRQKPDDHYRRGFPRSGHVLRHDHLDAHK
jgi:hypothetical protein